MITLGHVNMMFNVQAQGMDICYDPTTDEQFLNFKFSLSASLPQLLQQLLEWQQRDGMHGHPGTQQQQPQQQQQQQQQPQQPAPGGGMPLMGGQANNVMMRYGQPAPVTPQQPQMPQQTQMAQAQVTLPCGGAGQCALGPPPLGPVPPMPQQPPPAAPPPQLTAPPVQQPWNAQHSMMLQQPPAPAPAQPQQTPLQAQALQQQQQALDPGALQINMALLEALKSDNVQQARQLLQQRADVNFVEQAPTKRTPLIQVLESGGCVDAVNLLLKARANVNSEMANGRTPLHLAIQQYLTLPPLVIRMLLCNKADLSHPDSRGVTPLDNVRMVSMQAQQHPPPQLDAPSRMRQLLNEVTEMPTMDVSIIDGQRVQSAMFADVHNDRVIFSTESSIGIYSLSTKRIVFLKKLKQQQVTSAVKQISVNPEFGTVAVCLELLDMQQNAIVGRQNVFIVWPNGQLQDEEPLKLSIKVDPVVRSALPACVMLSKSQGSQMLLGRLVDGKIFCWHLNQARSQLVSETELTKEGGLVAVSGSWIAVVTSDGEGGSQQVSVFSYESAAGPQSKPEVVVRVPKQPQAMAIQQKAEASMMCYLALSEATPSDVGLASPVELFSMSVDGTLSRIFRLKAYNPCCCLSFCHNTPAYLLSGCVDGMAILYDLNSGHTSMCHDSPGTRSLDICTDRSLIVSAEDDYFRVFKVPAAQPSPSS